MKFKLRKCIAASVAVMAVAAVQSVYVSASAAPGTTDIPISDKPLFIGANSLPVLVMLVLSRDHSMYSEAYTDASDVDGDGKLDYYSSLRSITTVFSGLTYAISTSQAFSSPRRPPR